MSEQRKPASMPASPRRRGFLLTVGAGGAAVAAVALQSVPAPADSAPPDQAPAAGEGYRDTKHVRDYYRTTKI
jgi:hypothetical protein